MFETKKWIQKHKKTYKKIIHWFWASRLVPKGLSFEAI
uniref:Uncharacterized protein n=1 Tax=Arundo donax TaxID=35708 RepID=A0A0A8YPV4_ARUDO